MHPHEEVGQHFRWNRHVFHHRYRSARALDPAQSRIDLLDQMPEQFHLLRIESLSGTKSQTFRVPNPVDHGLDPVEHFDRIVFFHFDQ